MKKDKSKRNRDQAWFWTKEWQAEEKKVDEEIKKGDVIGPFDNIEDALKALKKKQDKEGKNVKDEPYTKEEIEKIERLCMDPKNKGDTFNSFEEALKALKKRIKKD